MVIWCSDVLCQNESPCNGIPNNELVNNPAFCGSYFLCIENEIGLDGICPTETPVFNSVSRQCDTLANYFCEDISTSDPCVGLDNDVKVNNPESCGAYWTCIEQEIGLDGTCPVETPVFNTNTGQCDTLENYFCVDTSLPVPPSDPCTGLENDVKVNNPENCGAYWTCIEETAAIPGQCLGDLPVFNPTTGQCDTVENYECFDPEIPDRCYGKENGWFINDPSHCHAYFVCWNNRISLSGRCDGLNFNEAEQLCDWQYDCVAQPPTTTAPETTTVENETDDPEETTLADETTETPIDEEPETPSSPCPPTGIVNIMQPGSCVNYFMCINGVAVPRECQPTLQFDSEQGGCNREELVRCVRSECPIEDDIDNIIFVESPWSCSE